MKHFLNNIIYWHLERRAIVTRRETPLKAVRRGEGGCAFFKSDDHGPKKVKDAPGPAPKAPPPELDSRI